MNPVQGRIFFTLGVAGLLASLITLLSNPSESARVVSLLLLVISTLIIAGVVVLVRREVRRHAL
ncbi:MAG: hypothetical protein QXW58_07045 [Thermosphaera sp.]